MKRFILSISMIALVCLFSGCPNPNQSSKQVYYTVTYTTEQGTAPLAITVEKDTVLNAEQLKTLAAAGFAFKGWFDGETEAVAGQYKVTKDVTLAAKWEKFILGSAEFPLEFGKVYNYKNKGQTYFFQFNSDGTAQYEKTLGGPLLEGYKYTYSVDTDSKAIYCHVDKYYYTGLNRLFGEWMSSDEFEKIYDNCLTEAKLRNLVLNNTLLKQDMINIGHLGENPADDDIWDTFLLEYAPMIPKTTSMYDYFAKQKPLEERDFNNVFSTVQKYQYEIDETIGKAIIEPVIYEEATLKDMFSPSSSGKLCWRLDNGETGPIAAICIGNRFQYWLDENEDAPEYSIREIKDGFIYLDDNPFIVETLESTSYRKSIGPIPYTETGKGENLVVSLTFEGSQYELKYVDNNNKK